MKKEKKLINKSISKKSNIFSLAKEITALTCNALSIGGIMTAIGLDEITNATPATVLTTAGLSLGVGLIGAGITIAIEIQEEKQKKKIYENDNTPKTEAEQAMMK